MLQSQGLRPLDPYRTLQIHPHAPRELVVEAYWALVARQKRRLATWPAAGKLIGDLNAAYGLLMDDQQRRTYDEEHGLTHLRAPHVRVTRRGFGVLGFGTTLTMVSDHADFYHLLRVDREADAEIIDLAHALLTRKAAGHDIEDVFLHDLLDEAYHTLRNPQRRAQYDASLASGTAPGVRAPLVAQAPSAALHVVVPKSEAPPPAEPAPEPVIADPPPASAPEAVPEMFSKAAPLDDSGDEPAIDVPAEHAAGGEEAQPAAVAGEPVAPGAPGASDAAASGPRRPPRSLLQLIGLGPRPNGHAPAHPALKEVRHDGLLDAEDARFLTLRDDGLESPIESPAPREHHVPHHLAAAAGDASLVFVAGPLAGERVPLGDEAVTIGTSFQSDIMLAPEGTMIAPEHARIWRHGDHFVFRQLDGSGTIIAGEPLTLPLVMLEDGDEIWIGAHRMRFSRNGQ